MKMTARGPKIIYAQLLDLLLGSSITPTTLTITIALVADRMVVVAEGDNRAICLLRDGLTRGGAVTYMEIT